MRKEKLKHLFVQCYYVRDDNTVKATSRPTRDESVICLRWPISTHFINLFVAGSACQMEGDYSNLARNTSTSDTVTPPSVTCGHCDRTHRQSENKHHLVRPHWFMQPCVLCMFPSHCHWQLRKHPSASDQRMFLESTCWRTLALVEVFA